ncbi:hypothetical protein H0H92_002019 [Tricholoma furcatifolium]|nr:hypothetical protein H0H92_002019 [Tricholoma furcatifolium]
MSASGGLLPQELINAIIDATVDAEEDIDKSSLQTLFTFSLVSKAWSLQCIKHIFHTIEFSTDAGEDVLAERFQQFISIVDRNSRILPCVKKLVIRDLETPAWGTKKPWMITNTQFHKSLVRLSPTLKTFTFIAEDYAWSSFPATLKHAFLAIFTSPVLEFLRLQGLEAAPSACSVAFSKNISHLIIVRSSFLMREDPDLPVLDQGCIPQNLYWLCLEDVDDVSLRTLLKTWTTPGPTQDHSYFPALEAICIGPTEEDELVPLRDLVLAGKDTIQYFYWTYFHGSQARPLHTSPLDMSLLPRLFAIEYEVTFYSEHDMMPDVPDHFDGLLALLQTVTPGAIQQLDIKVDYQDLDDARASLDRYHGWKQLETLLNSKPFEELDRVGLQIVLEVLSRDEDRMDVDDDEEELIKEEIEDLLERRFPLLFNMNEFSLKLVVRRHMVF